MRAKKYWILGTIAVLGTVLGYARVSVEYPGGQPDLSYLQGLKAVRPVVLVQVLKRKTPPERRML
jgi:hypothetical protein